jgi:hypothetical protein
MDPQNVLFLVYFSTHPPWNKDSFRSGKKKKKKGKMASGFSSVHSRQ